MALELTYKNNSGTVTMYGCGKGVIRICKIEGLGVIQKEYEAATYTGQTGQVTLSSRPLPRCITLSLEVFGENTGGLIKDTLRILSREGMLYIKNRNIDRRIYCNQVQIPDIEQVLKGRISTFAVQFVCDNPYFFDGGDRVVSLYKRIKLLETPFVMPCMFGEITAGADICNTGDADIEPQLVMYCPKETEGVENITLINRTTGKSICLDYAPMADDTVVIDVKNRSITSSKSGNLLNYISDSTFLGDFVFVPGHNLVELNLGDITEGFTIECRFSNLYSEAVNV